MTKLKIGDGEFLENIPHVSLTSNFGTELTDALQAIENNFKKLISVPFLKGEHGEDVKLFHLPLLNNDNTLTKLGKAVVKEIYSLSYEPDEFSETLDNPYGGKVHGKDSYDLFISSNPMIAFYGYIERTQSSEKIIIASQQMFIFIDSRINELENIDTRQLTTFEDLSCALTVTGELSVNIDTGEYDIDNSVFNTVKYNIIPTLYYDIQTKEWCWKINGAKSKISAQGISGENGSDASVVVCSGIKISTDATGQTPFSVQLDQVLTSNGTMSSNVDSIPNGQLAIVWFEDGGDLNCTFGRVEGNSTKLVYVGHSDFNSTDHLNWDLLTAIDNISLRKLMNDIANTENTQNITTSSRSCRGIWVPDKFVSTPNGNNGTITSNGNVHMIWSDNSGNKVAHFGLVRYEDTQGNSTPPSNPVDPRSTTDSTSVNSSLNFHYETVTKDFIEAGRTQRIPSYSRKITSIQSSSPFRILASSRSEPEKSVYQYIQIKNNSQDNKILSINGSGLYLIGKPSDKIYSVEIDGDKRIIDSEISIATSDITITGYAKTNTNICPLTSQICKDNIMNDSKILINQENVILSNGSLLIGAEKSYNQFNVYTQHYGNSTLYNFDYGSLLRSNSLTDASFYWSNSRPRYAAYVPVQIGGWLTMYNSRTVNKNANDGTYSYIFEQSSPVELTTDENWKHTLLSGKFGYTSSVISTGDPRNAIASESIRRDTIKEYQTIRYLSGENRETEKYGVAVSMSGIWTKIGNVVDVKGKIFFNGVKLHIETTSQGTEIVPKSNWVLSYSSLYDFIMKNIGAINFPFPVVLKNDNVSYVSTGNVFNNGFIQSSIGINGTYDTHLNTDSNKPKNRIISCSIDPNDILNGKATIHFFGNTKNVNVYNRPSNSNPNIEYNNSSIEALPNVFSCCANIMKTSNDTWSLFAIPQPEVLDGDPKLNTAHNDQVSRFGNNMGPVRISNGKETELGGGYSLIYNHIMARPVVIGKNNINDKIANEEYIDRQIVSGDKRYRITNSDVTGPQEMTLYASTVISPYIVRYMTFEFSYLLDDDIYGNTLPQNRNGNTSNSHDFDSENWPLSNAFQNMDTILTSPLSLEVFEDAGTGNDSGNGR